MEHWQPAHSMSPPLFGGRRKKAAEPVQNATEAVHLERSRLELLAPNNPKMYHALQNFLLADPERQIIQLGDAESFKKKADEELKRGGDKLTARVNYEYAAKIEIYNQNRENASTYLTLARNMTNENDPHHEYCETMLSNMDEAMRISKEYYDKVARTS